MKYMICLRGEPDQLAYLPEIAELGAGIELQSYGMSGVRSPEHWAACLTRHQAIRQRFTGPLALHGPFIGMEFSHMDYLVRSAVQRRMDMTLEVVQVLNVSCLILHSGYQAEFDLFGLQEMWLEDSITYWREEIIRWANAGVVVVLENDIDRTPGLLVRLVDAVDSPFLGLCLDVGHQHMFSDLEVTEWVRQMAHRLHHVHLHDNDRGGDWHWAIGRGTFDFGSFYDAMLRFAPGATLSLEVQDAIKVKMQNLRQLAGRFASL